MFTVVLVTGVSPQGCLLFLDPFSIKLLVRPLTRDVPFFFLNPSCFMSCYDKHNIYMFKEGKLDMKDQIQDRPDSVEQVVL